MLAEMCSQGGGKRYRKKEAVRVEKKKGVVEEGMMGEAVKEVEVEEGRWSSCRRGKGGGSRTTRKEVEV